MPTARRTKSPEQVQQASLDAFLDAKAKVDTLLARLQAASENHFDANPETFLWGHAASLGRVEYLLDEALAMVGA